MIHNYINSLKNYLNCISNWIFPYRCIFCQKSGINYKGLMCTNCLKEIIFLQEPLCNQCGKAVISDLYEKCDECKVNNNYFSQARALVNYQRQVKPLIHRLKNKNDIYLFKKCAELIVKQFSYFIKKGDIIIPVPTHWTRRLRRGYNPPDVLGWYISKLSKIPYSRTLKKIKITSYQKGKSRIERSINLVDSFKVRKINKINNKTIILVDDVFTTGATVNECSKELIKNGAKDVIVITLAKVP